MFHSYLILLLLLFQINLIHSFLFNFKQNTCTSLSAYNYQFNSLNSKCYVDKTANMEAGERIENEIGSQYMETYNVTTRDGFILQLFRLRRDKPKGVILLQHPMTGDARMWLLQRNESTAVRYWQLGYDVWLPNNRGTRYGKNHTTLDWRKKSDDRAFWDFTFHELAVCDHPTVFEFIHQKVRQKFVYIGHSLSSTSVLIYASMYPKLAQQYIKVAVCTAPTVFMRNARGFSKLGFSFYKLVQPLARLINLNSVLDNDSAVFRWMQKGAYYLPIKAMMAHVMALGSGGTYEEFDPRYAVTISNVVSGFPVKVAWHFGQIANSNKFRMFDYGWRKNIKIYKRMTPPEYPLNKITIPIYILSSESDDVGSAKDANTVFNNLPEQAKIYGMTTIYGINHLDYHTGKHRWEKVWGRIMDFLETEVI